MQRNPRIEWYRDIYSRAVYLRLYETIDRERAAREASSAALLLELKPAERVLDVACGFGRHVAELERLGFQAAGVDLSGLLLCRAAEHDRASNLPARYVRADLRSLPFTSAFDATVNFFVSFGYLDDAGNALAMSEIARTLRPGGRFLLETWNAEQVIASLQPRVVEQREDVTIIERSRYNTAARRVEWTNDARFRTGERERWSQSVRAYTPDEWRALLDGSGLVNVRLLGDWDGSAFTAQSPRLILLAHTQF